MRRSTAQIEEELQDLAVRALIEKVGPVTEAADGRADLVVDVDGRRLAIDLRATAYGTVERVDAMRRRHPPRDDLLVLFVADRINRPAQDALRSLGWGYFDASTGALFLRGSGVLVDTTVDTVATGPDAKPSGIVGWTGRIVAYELLRRHFDQDPNRILTSRSEKEFGAPRSSTSDALRALAAADLIIDGEPVVPQLFWELARVWAPADRRWLASVPDPADWVFEHDPTRGSWRIGGARAAAFHGAPVVDAGEGAVELYVPGPVLLSIATRRYGVAEPLSAAASVAVPTVHQVTRSYYPDEVPELLVDGWPVVHPVAAVLDLAALDDARSLQILSEWHPRGAAVWHEP